MLKKLLAILAALSMVLSLAACGSYEITIEKKDEEKNYREIEPKFVTEDDINTFQSNIKEQMNNIDKHIEAIEQKIEKISKREEGGKKPYNSTQSQKVG